MDGHVEIVPNRTARFLYFINVIAVANSKWGSPVYGYDYVWRLHKM